MKPVFPHQDQGLVHVRRYGTLSVATQLRDEAERWLLPRGGVTRSIALSRRRGVGDCSVLEMNMVCSYVSDHFVHDTYHSGQSRTVSPLLVLYVNLEIPVVDSKWIWSSTGMILLSSILAYCSSTILFFASTVLPGRCSDAGCTSQGVCHE